jgi:hypothetical protein
MFKSVTVTSGNFDVGLIAEALVYYEEVYVVASRGALVDMAKAFGPRNLEKLFEAGQLHVSFERVGYAVRTDQIPFTVHSFGDVGLVATEDGRKIRDAHDEIEVTLQRELGKSADSRALTNLLAKYSTVSETHRKIIEAANSDMQDREYLTRACAAWLATIVPEYQMPKNFRIEPEDTGSGFVILTGLDFDEINRFYHRRIPKTHSSVTPAYFLAHIIDVRKELAFSAESESDIWLSASNSVVLQEKTKSLLARTGRAAKDIDVFHDVVFEGRDFREAVNTGRRSVDDILKLLDDQQTRKFKAWLSRQPDDAKLVEEFHRTVFARDGWWTKVPFKAGKLSLFAAAGLGVDTLVGTAGLGVLAGAAMSAGADIALGASDEFLQAKLGKGWKPSQFVEGPAKKFLTPTESE